MGCRFEVFLLPEDRDFLPRVLEALDEVERLESILSVYRETSEVCRANRAAAEAAVPLGPELFDLLRLSARLGRQTRGAFDVTIGALIRCWGFVDGNGRLPGEDEIAAARSASGWGRLEFDQERRTVRFCRRGMELNFGSIGKGYALARAGGMLRRAGLRRFLMHAGQSSILAVGDSASGPGWTVALRDPAGARARWGSALLVDRSLSTSGSGTRFFLAGGKRLGHLIDPRTGRPAVRNLACSVAARDPAVAEAFSTAFFVMSENEIDECCARFTDLATMALFQADEGASPEPRVWGTGVEFVREKGS